MKKTNDCEKEVDRMQREQERREHRGWLLNKIAKFTEDTVEFLREAGQKK